MSEVGETGLLGRYELITYANKKKQASKKVRQALPLCISTFLAFCI